MRPPSSELQRPCGRCATCAKINLASCVCITNCKKLVWSIRIYCVHCVYLSL